MDGWNSKIVADNIQRKLEELVIKCFEEYDGKCDLELKVQHKVNEQMYGFLRSSTFTFGLYGDYKVDVYEHEVNKGNGIVYGKIVFKHTEIKKPNKYGRPGFKGNKNGEICQYPDFKDSYYQWDEFSCKWRDVTTQICSEKNTNLFGGLSDNAAFESMWGDNPGGEDIFGNNGRKANGEKMWRNPQMRKPLGTFKKISANIFKSIYNFTLDLKSAISHYLKLNEALKSDDPEIIEEIEKLVNFENISIIDEPKVLITVEKVNDWSYFYNNGYINQAGNLTRKDTLVYPKDIQEVRKTYKKKVEQKKERARKDFENKN